MMRPNLNAPLTSAKRCGAADRHCRRRRLVRMAAIAMATPPPPAPPLRRRSRERTGGAPVTAMPTTAISPCSTVPPSHATVMWARRCCFAHRAAQPVGVGTPARQWPTESHRARGRLIYRSTRARIRFLTAPSFASRVLLDDRQAADRRVRLLEVGAGGDEAVLHHQQAVDRLVRARRADGVAGEPLGRGDERQLPPNTSRMRVELHQVAGHGRGAVRC